MRNGRCLDDGISSDDVAGCITNLSYGVTTMIIIIEGPDGSGKTTLAKTLSEKTGWPIIHRSAPKSEEEKKAMKVMYHSLIAENTNAILDRCWYSEMAYGPTMRDESVISYPEMYELEKCILANGALLIYCTSDKQTLWKRCQQRGEDYVMHLADFVDICEAYDEIMSVPHLIPVVKYEYKEM
jgi:thymidylate kinase